MSMNNLMKQAQQMQAKLAMLQNELAEREVEASAGGGMVKVKVNGKQQLLSISINKDCVDPNDVVGNTSASLHQAGEHLSSSAGLIATQSPSPRIDVHHQYQQQQQQQQTASQLPLSQVLHSLDNAEAALALALQG